MFRGLIGIVLSAVHQLQLLVHDVKYNLLCCLLGHYISCWFKNIELQYTLTSVLCLDLRLCMFLIVLRTLLLQMRAWAPTLICQGKLNVTRVSWMGSRCIMALSGLLVVSYYTCWYDDIYFKVSSRHTEVQSPGSNGNRQASSSFTDLLSTISKNFFERLLQGIGIINSYNGDHPLFTWRTTKKCC